MEFGFFQVLHLPPRISSSGKPEIDNELYNGFTLINRFLSLWRGAGTELTAVHTI